jgi:hypothetical protein
MPNILIHPWGQCHAFSKAQDTLRSLLQALAEVEREKSQLRYEAGRQSTTA